MKCKQCGNETEEKRFATFRDRKGNLRRRSVCWDCRNGYAEQNFERLQEWRREYNAKTKTKRQEAAKQRREAARKLVDEYKARPCADCGKQWPPVAMDLDHVTGNKVRGVASMVGAAYKPELILEEIAKCEVVCACCHRLRTAARGENQAPRKVTA